jgi:hypothetical protein
MTIIFLYMFLISYIGLQLLLPFIFSHQRGTIMHVYRTLFCLDYVTPWSYHEQC